MQRSRRLIGLVILVLVLAMLAACGGAETAPPTATQERVFDQQLSPWPSSTPEEQGMDSAMLVKLLDYIEQREFPMHSVVVVRNGKLVMEVYYPPFQPGGLHSLNSATQSVTSALIGIAIDQGLIKGVDETVLSFFPGETFQNSDERKRSINIEHLLTMASGLDWGEWATLPDQHNIAHQMMVSERPLKFVLDRPMLRKPSEDWSYNSGGPHVLSAILQRVTGGTTREYAQKQLFEPLGITQLSWGADPQGITLGGRGLRLTPRDMAKLGQLYLNGGAWEGRQLVSPEWVKQSVAQHYPLQAAGYGYSWWQPEVGGFQALGGGGQAIFVMPEQQLVVVFNSSLTKPEAVLNTLIKSYILQSASSAGPLPANPDQQAALKQRIAGIQSPPSRPPAALPEAAQAISGKRYELPENSLGLRSFALSFSGDQATGQFDFGGQAVEAAIGLDERYRITPLAGGEAARPPFGYDSAASIAMRGRWKDPQSFALHVLLENGAGSDLSFKLDGEHVTLSITGLDARIFERVEAKAL